MKQNILIILGHPGQTSLCRSLAENYLAGAKTAGADATLLDLAAMDINFVGDARENRNPEEDLTAAQSLISAATHLVWVYPVWWGTAPAILKGFVDRTLTSGFAFQYEGDSPMPKRLLGKKTSRILLTMDSPSFWHRFVYRGSAVTWLRWATLWFCGIKTKKTKEFCLVRKADATKINAWLKEAWALGERDAIADK